MSDKSLLLLLDEVRAKTLRRLEGVTDAQSQWTPPGLQNSILWHAGHAYVVVETLASRGLGIPPVYPEGWFVLFSWESRPGEVSTERWPQLSEVVTRLHEQKDRLRASIQSRSESDLDQPSPGNPERTARLEILHGLHDEACHSGEIWLLRKLQRGT
jgi:hypothetical protein